MPQNRTSAFVKVRLQKTKFYSAEMNHKFNKDEQCHFKFITKLFIKGFSILTFMLNQLLFIMEQLSGQTKCFTLILSSPASSYCLCWCIVVFFSPVSATWPGFSRDCWRQRPWRSQRPSGMFFLSDTCGPPKKNTYKVAHTLQWKRVFRHL